MKKSFRAKRMERHHARNKQASLNLTSLMDIFTILVFFLMVNSGDGTQITDTESLKMPISVATESPRPMLVLQVSETDIVVQGRKVADISAVKESGELIIAGLDEELKYQAERQPEMTEEEKEFGRPITIQADSKLPYTILKQVMSTCAMAEYRNISLAVTQKVGG